MHNYLKNGKSPSFYSCHFKINLDKIVAIFEWSIIDTTPCTLFGCIQLCPCCIFFHSFGEKVGFSMYFFVVLIAFWYHATTEAPTTTEARTTHVTTTAAPTTTAQPTTTEEITTTVVTTTPEATTTETTSVQTTTG